jgi:hypothetical protein
LTYTAGSAELGAVIGPNLVGALGDLAASLAPPQSITALALALALLGFGWSLGLIAGTTAITNNTPVATRAPKPKAPSTSASLSPAQAVDFSPVSSWQGPATQP